MLMLVPMPIQTQTKFWLMKSEPSVYSIDCLRKDQKTLWTGVRNYQARNFMTTDMRPGDQVFFYHSSAEPPGIAGLAKVASLAVPDPSAFDKKSEAFDPKSTKEKPIWFCVEIQFVKRFSRLLELSKIKAHKSLQELLLLRPGQRLSIQPVSAKDFQTLLELSAQVD